MKKLVQGIVSEFHILPKAQVAGNKNVHNFRNSFSSYLLLSILSGVLAPKALTKALKPVPQYRVKNCLHFHLLPIVPLERCAYTLTELVIFISGLFVAFYKLYVADKQFS